MEHVPDRVQFAERAVAAPTIFSYVTGHAGLRRLQLQFEYGMVDRNGVRAVAKFSARGNAVVWVSAVTRVDGSWHVTHQFGSFG